jgi:hypothetical protein
MSHKFDAKNAAVLDDPGRKEFLNPEAILDMLDLTQYVNPVIPRIYQIQVRL